MSLFAPNNLPSPVVTNYPYGFPSLYTVGAGIVDGYNPVGTGNDSIGTVSALSARESGSEAVEINSEGVIQQNGLSTRGMLMLGGPEVNTRNVTIITDAAFTLTPEQMVDGIFLIVNTALTTLTLPNPAALAQFISQRQLTVTIQPPAVLLPSLWENYFSQFKLTIVANCPVNIVAPAAYTSGSSAYYFTACGPSPADVGIFGLNAAATIVTLFNQTATTTQRFVFDLFFGRILNAFIISSGQSP